MEVKNLWGIVSPRLRTQVQEGLVSPERIAEFCKAAPGTVRSWIKGEHPAKGEKLIRLWHLLAIGGSAPELQRLPEFNRLVSELFAFDVINITEAQLLCGLNSDHVSNAYATLRGQDVMRPYLDVHDIRREYDERLRAAKQSFGASVAPEPVEPIREKTYEAPPDPTPVVSEEPPPAATPAVVAPAPAPVSVSPSLFQTDPKLILASLLGAAAPIAKQLNSDAITAEERSQFRELIGAEVLFELSTTLNALCSERSRGLAR
ncbi:MAG: hypothetical protein WAQ27_00215 [Candidatus Microsaccharimonas sp.]